MAQWVISEVVKAGAAEDGNMYVRLASPLGGEFPGSRWFPAAPGVRKEILATALTAITTRLRVNAYLEALDEYSTLNRLYVSRED
jgi:hypothetical protein